MSERLRDALADILEGRGQLAVAVSGGVDSLTLMTHAHRALPAGVVAFHAVSSAVPASSTARVEELSAREGWSLTILDAGEMRDPAYLSNPVDRCRHCKTHLYDAIAESTSAQIVSGTNLDDISDFRPGLEAAKAHGVRHPFVEARIGKSEVRILARSLGLGDIAELPAQPCLSSRVETGIAIQADMLATVNRVEEAAREILGRGATIRCRVRRSGYVLELDALATFDDVTRAGVLEAASRAAGHNVAIAPYRMGSAFLRVVAS